MLAGTVTDIVAIDFATFASAGVRSHQRAALAAIEVSGEQIVVLFLVRRGSNGELFNGFLHFIESFLRDYGRNAVLETMPE